MMTSLYKRFLYATVAVYTCFTSTVVAAESVKFELPETVELAMVVAILSDFDPSGQQINREGEYVERIHSYFAPYKNHQLIQSLGSNFSLPRLAGNAADFILDEDSKLVEIDDSGSLWGDAQGDLFRKHLSLLEDFAQQSRFREFYQSQAEFYQTSITSVSGRTDAEAMTEWLENNFTSRPGPMQIIISPLISGLNWTTLFKPQTRMWVAPNTDREEGAISDYKKVLDSYSVFTELDHSYVNPQTKKILDHVEAGFANLDNWATPGSSATNYANPELQFNEYMTWSVYLMYARDALNDNDFARLTDSITSFMVDSRGFSAFNAFNEEALRLYTEESLSGEAIMLQMARWAKNQTP